MEEWIEEGCILVNGSIVMLGDCIEEGDELCVDGCIVEFFMEEESICRVIFYYKLEGEVCMWIDLVGCFIVFDFLFKLKDQWWVVIGCLDINSQGLLLFIIDGDLVNCMMYFFFNIEREYVVCVCGEVIEDSLKVL